VFWNMQDPVVGGMSKEKVALRRALGDGRTTSDEEIRVVRNGQAVEAQFPIPPGRRRPRSRSSSSSVKFDPAARTRCSTASATRRAPTAAHAARRQAAHGQLLLAPDSLGRQQEEMWKKAFDLVLDRMEGVKEKFPSRSSSRSSASS
jgi:hypothetical protein